MMESENNICCILNYAPHYRASIYIEMEKELGCRFYFGDSCGKPIKKMDYSLFAHEVKELKFKQLFHNFVIFKGSCKLIKDGRYQKYILNGEPYIITVWLSLLLAKLYNKEIYLWSHGMYGREEFLKTSLKKIFFGLAKGVFLYGEYAKTLMVSAGINSNKLHVIANSLDYDTHKDIRKRLSQTDIYSQHFLNDYPTLVFIGRITATKRLDMLIEALNVINKRDDGCNLIIVGDGKELAKLKLLVKEYNLDKYVWFYGECYDETKLAELIYNADLCVAPGNVGLTAIHSLSFGTPIITHGDFANQMPEFEAIEASVTGNFFKREDLDDMVYVISNWLKKYPYKENELIDRCYRVIDEKYNPYAQIELLKKILE